MTHKLVHANDAECGLPLPGLDGTNPLGFLAALGTLQILAAVHGEPKVSMSWKNCSFTWNPVLHGVDGNKQLVASQIATHLQCPFQPNPEAEVKRQEKQTAFDKKKSELKRAVDDLKQRGLRGNERKAAEDNALAPIRVEMGKLRTEWLAALRACVPSLELSLGKHLNATRDELRQAMLLGLEESSQSQRKVVDLYSAFGSDSCSLDKNDQMEATQFCFITGSGHQYFLDTVRQLITNLNASRFEEALFHAIEPSDEKLSMRWDPQEDRRYAVMWSDPTASDNKAKTNWAINLLAYLGLQLLPSIPIRKGLRTTGWSREENPTWNWAIWHGRMSALVVRSVLSHPCLVNKDIKRDHIAATGVAAVYQSARVQVGNPPLHKVNFTPARRMA